MFGIYMVSNETILRMVVCHNSLFDWLIMFGFDKNVHLHPQYNPRTAARRPFVFETSPLGQFNLWLADKIASTHKPTRS